ncbi:hypothetical protein EUTSA_v10021722mg [Eutrema salsugineum]|uniref:Coiled-coil domain-containing protein 12 n=1 Tax=Eutrema salsugineum TaxID=72664 RepID=V4M3V9_EUTSA|nr:coiled-coil domain-containing protein 12 [Eutrema salsugineum]ESQ49567.1 hypothetical protein EUTSA_v10021722mg [Eutrema salsugineum]
MASEDDSIEQRSAARKEALRALKAAQELSESKEDGQDDAVEEDGPAMKFRNYVPQDKELQDGKVAPPELPKFEDPIAALAPAVEKKEDPFVNIAPKKPNWDLRRDVQKKLDKLERRTQAAMSKLTQEKREMAEADGDALES